MGRLRTVGRLATITCILIGFSGCAAFIQITAPIVPPKGAIFIDVKAPLTIDVNATSVDGDLLKVSKGGTSYFHDVLFTNMNFAWDEAGLQEIARDGGIQNIAYADYEYMNILGVYATFTVNVYGN